MFLVELTYTLRLIKQMLNTTDVCFLYKTASYTAHRLGFCKSSTSSRAHRLSQQNISRFVINKSSKHKYWLSAL